MGADDLADKNGSHHVDQKVCNAGFLSSNVDTSSLLVYTHGGGETAQAYKSNAPVTNSVCDETSFDDKIRHKVAHRSFWRSDYKDLVPISIRGNLYSCNGAVATAARNEDALVEVWQPRPDGTFSSIRPGVDEGDCRASVPIILLSSTTNNKSVNNETDVNTDTDNKIGTVEFETFAPGSIGILNGLVPSSSRDYPPYKPGSIHMFFNIAGYQPLVVQLRTSELNDWIPKRISNGRFKSPSFRKAGSNRNGIEIQSVTPTIQHGYEMAIEVEVNFFLVENDMDTKGSMEEIFCSRKGVWNWIPSFFKEPVSICYASYLDFFAL